MPHLRRRRDGYDPIGRRPFIVRELVLGGRVLMVDSCDPRDCRDHELLLEAHAEERWRRDPIWSRRRQLSGGVLFFRHRLR